MSESAKVPPPASAISVFRSKRRQSFWNRFDSRRDGLRLAMVLALLLVINIAVWWIAIRPLQARIDQREESKRVATQTERLSKKRLKELREVHEHALAVESGIRTFFDDMLSVKVKRMVAFQKAVHEVGKEFRVQPQRVASNMSQLEAEGIEVFTYTFPLHGGYENLRRFLERLERLNQFLIIREVALRSSSKDGGRNLQLDIAVETYFNAPNMREEIERERLWKKKNKARNARRRRGR